MSQGWLICSLARGFTRIGQVKPAASRKGERSHRTLCTCFICSLDLQSRRMFPAASTWPKETLSSGRPDRVTGQRVLLGLLPGSAACHAAASRRRTRRQCPSLVSPMSGHPEGALCSCAAPRRLSFCTLTHESASPCDVLLRRQVSRAGLLQPGHPDRAASQGTSNMAGGPGQPASQP